MGAYIGWAAPAVTAAAAAGLAVAAASVTSDTGVG